MNLFAIFRNHPRLPRLLVTRSLALSFALGGCVPATQYEQASSAAEVEREGHRRAVVRLNAAEEELQRVQARNEELAGARKEIEGKLLEEENHLAQASLDIETTKKSQEHQAELVTQLRGELARVGDHLKTFRDEKTDLETRLTAAEARATLLEAEVARLLAKAQDSQAAEEQLQGALNDLEKLQEELNVPEEPQKTQDSPSPSEEITPDDSSSEGVTPGEQSSPTENSEQAPSVSSPAESSAEVLPTEEAEE